MTQYIVYSLATKRILRQGICPAHLLALQAQASEIAIKGTADDRTQKIEHDGLDKDGRPINPRIANKTPEEIIADNPPAPVIPEEDKRANMTNKDVDAILARLDVLETQP